MNYNTNIARHERTGLYYIKYDGLLLRCLKQWRVKQNQPVAHIYTDTWIDLHK